MKNRVEKVCIVGTGGVGGYFGGKMVGATASGEEKTPAYTFIARGEHLAAIQKDGLTLVTPDGSITARPDLATERIGEITEPDLVLLCVKGYDLDNAVKLLAPKVSEATVIIPLLNGADIYERIRKRLKTGFVLPACVFVGTHIDRPGVIRQEGGDGKILFGKDPEHSGFDAEHIRAFFDNVGVPYEWFDDPRPAIWKKFIFIAAFGLVTVYTGKGVGGVAEDGKARRLAADIMGEIDTIARAKGIFMADDIVDQSLAKANHFPFDTKTSYQRDVENKGKRNEGDLFGGTIVREGLATGVPTPVTEKVSSAIQKRLNGLDL